MAISFPENPTLNQEYVVDSKIFVWDGEKWLVRSSAQVDLAKKLATVQILTSQFFA